VFMSSVLLFCFPLQVRWSACQALGQMCTDLGPELQTKCGAGVLPALLAAMDDFANPRVQVGEGGRLNLITWLKWPPDVSVSRSNYHMV
jgi:hypothetical protein